jgi:hypothetical protein
LGDLPGGAKERFHHIVDQPLLRVSRTRLHPRIRRRLRRHRRLLAQLSNMLCMLLLQTLLLPGMIIFVSPLLLTRPATARDIMGGFQHRRRPIQKRFIPPLSLPGLPRWVQPLVLRVLVLERRDPSPELLAHGSRRLPNARHRAERQPE